MFEDLKIVVGFIVATLGCALSVVGVVYGFASVVG